MLAIVMLAAYVDDIALFAPLSTFFLRECELFTTDHNLTFKTQICFRSPPKVGKFCTQVTFS